jgi:hypothetical protein
MGAGCSRAPPVAPAVDVPPKCLVLHSQHALAIPGLELALLENPMAVRAQYDFASSTAEDMVALLERLEKQHGKFACIALAPLGPDRPPTERVGAEECRWEISEQLVMSDPSGLIQPKNEIRVVLEALGRATVEHGRVDLLSCDVLATWACPEAKWPKLMAFGDIEEVTACRFTASRNMLHGNPIEGSEDDEWPMESDGSIDVRAAYLVPPLGATTRLRASALRQRYVLREQLGTGQFATVYRATRRFDPTDTSTKAPLNMRHRLFSISTAHSLLNDPKELSTRPSLSPATTRLSFSSSSPRGVSPQGLEPNAVPMRC